MSFTWIPFYKELAEQLLSYRDRQNELIAILQELKDQALPVVRLNDKAAKDKTVPLSAIDPFTFFAAFNRKATDQNRQAILTVIKDRLQVQAAVPADFDGIPIVHPMQSWFFRWQYERKPEDIPTLWAFAEAIVTLAPENIAPELFNRCLEVDCVTATNLTMGMFWMRPDTYLALDKRNRALLDKRGVEHEVTDWTSYLQFMKDAKLHIPEPPYEFSRTAFTGESDKKYWLFQGTPKYYDVVGALRDGAIKTWEVNQYKAKIHPGDKVIIWVAGESAGCYALATVLSEVQSAPEDEKEALYRKEPRKSGAMDGVTLRIDTNLWDRPVLKMDMHGNRALSDLPTGRQGTNFVASKAHYEGILALARERTGMRYWIYAPGRDARYWDECCQKEIMLFGADELPALDSFVDKVAIEKALKKAKNLKHRPTNDARAAWEFARVLSPGDIVIVKKGIREFLGYGVVTGPYRYESERTTYRNVRPVRWVKKGEWKKKKGGPIVQKALTDITKYPDYVEDLKTLIGIDDIELGTLISPLAQNVILYGPPGTGKTYISLRRAVEGATGKPLQDSAKTKQQVGELRSKGQIEFVTFHQSYSYEDFVEGIRPVLEANVAALRYECSAGVFKKLALRALYDCLVPREAQKTGEFDSRWQALVAQIAAEPERPYPSITGNSDYRLALSTRGNVTATNTKDPEVSRLIFSRSNLLKVFAAHSSEATVSTTTISATLGVGSHSSLGAVLFRELQKVKPITSKVQLPDLTSDDERCDAALDFLNAGDSSQYRLRQTGSIPHYVLIIDEINRGNISKIFGELITLIEGDKRIGADNEMRVVLPYSKDLFGVPPNLHIIGTMNTADKSIALVDVALRRRFEFEELMPDFDDAEKCPGLSDEMRTVLKEFNRRIQLRKDRDHQIGHAYFRSVKDVAGFNKEFVRRIIPLLQEYFYSDWEGLRYVLGETKEEGDFISRIPTRTGELKPRHAWQWCFDTGVKRDGFDAWKILKRNYDQSKKV